MSAPAWTAPVRFAETDQQGVVFNAHYLTWCDEAMTAYFTERGVGHDALDNPGRRLHIVKSELTWSAPARWGQLVTVYVEPEQLGRTSFTMCFDVRADDKISATVRTTYVTTGETGRPIPVPADLRAHVTPAVE